MLRGLLGREAAEPPAPEDSTSLRVGQYSIEGSSRPFVYVPRDFDLIERRQQINKELLVQRGEGAMTQEILSLDPKLERLLKRSRTID